MLSSRASTQSALPQRSTRRTPIDGEIRPSRRATRQTQGASGVRPSRRTTRRTLGFYEMSGTDSQLRASEISLRDAWAELRLKDSDVPDTCLGKLLFHPRFEACGGFVILLNFVVMTMETHATSTDDKNILEAVNIANFVLLLYYTAEFILRLCVLKRSFFQAGWNILDLTIVVTGWISEILEVFQVTAGIDQISMLKSLRMLRMLRLLRLFVAFRELYVLVAGIGRCMKTLFWASGLIFVVLNVWAILSVEFLDERIRKLIPSDAYNACGWCETAFSNIWQANLTWFQIISTSDWTTIGRPLAEAYIWPYAFFVLNVFIVIWGLLNLIVAAIVDANIAARDDDVAIAATIAEQSYTQAFDSFEQICRDMDADGSGDVSVKEFKLFLKQNVELQQHLKIMGIQEQDVNDLLKFMDEDGNGTLESDEFIAQFTTMRTLVEKTSIYFLLRYCQNIQNKLVQQSNVMQSLQKEMALVKSSWGIARTSELMHDTSVRVSSIPSATFSLRSNETSCRESVAASGEVKPTAQTLRTTARSEMPRVDPKRLPFGWYYFGASLPPEATKWCTTTDMNKEVIGTNSFRAARPDIDESTAVPVASDGQGWEPLSSNRMHNFNAKHIYVKAPLGDGQLPPEIIGALASVDRFVDSICSNPDNKEFPVKNDVERWEPLPSSSFRLQHAKHVYARAPIGDVQLPPEIVQSLDSVDRFIDGVHSEPLAATYDIASEHGAAHHLLQSTVQRTKHVYARAPIGDVQLPPEIVQSLDSVDRLIDGVHGEPLAANYDVASEHGAAHDLLQSTMMTSFCNRRIQLNGKIA